MGFTKGPWKVYGADMNEPTIDVKHHSHWVENACYGDAEATANTLLMAAAPELFEACVVALAWFESNTGAATVDDFGIITDRLRAALKKAGRG